MTFWRWSQTAASNATADTTINAREGQAPSTVNDAMRAMMAAAAKFRDDRSGNLVTGGSSTAYTLATNQTLTSLTDGFAVTARMSATNGAAPTLNVDSLGAKVIAGVYGTAIPIGALRSGGVYTFVYDSTDDKWIVHGIGPASHLTPTDGNIIVGDGSGWVTESGATARTSLGLGTGDSPQFTAVNIGNASDTTISRVSAGRIAVEGVNVVTISSTDTLTNKTLTSPTLTTPVLGTPASGTLTNCTGYPFTSLSGTLTSAQLAAYLTDETGSGANVHAVSPALTGSPTAPTQSAATENTTIATTAFVWSTLGAPSGTTMLFNNTSAPLGWTKDTNGSLNHALRLTGGTVSGRDTTGFTSVFAARTIELANMPSHTHTFSGTTGGQSADHTHTTTFDEAQVDDTNEQWALARPGTGEGGIAPTYTTGGTSNDHTHSFSGTTGAAGNGSAMDFNVAYVDVIRATRN
jgi:hypothetical protein